MKYRLMVSLLFVASSGLAQHHTPAKTGYADSVNAGLIKVDTLKGSPARMAMADVGDLHVHITYSSPGVKGRVIWGGVVSNDEVWVAGAHSATKISFSKPVMVNNKRVEAGSYGLFVIPHKDTWTFVLNTKADMHLADDYDMKNDVVRMDIVPEQLPVEVKRLTYTVEPGSQKDEFHVKLSWEKKRIIIPFKVIR